MKKPFCYILAALVIAALVVSAGCITEEKTGLLTQDQLTSSLDRLVCALDTSAADADARVSAFAAALGNASSVDEIRIITRAFYIDNIKLTGAGYYDAENNRSYLTPFAPQTASLKPVYDTASLTPNKTTIIGPLAGAGNGVLAAFVHPVCRDGKTAGAVFAFFDPVTFVSDAAVSIGGLNGSAAVLADTEGTIFYSAFAGAIGRNYSDYAKTWDNVTVLPRILGAETGISEVYSGLTAGISAAHVKKQAAWTTDTAFGRTFRIAVITEEKAPALTQADIPNRTEVDTALKALYTYALYNSKEQTLAELNKPDGKFSHDDFTLYAFDTDGTLLASGDRTGQIGHSFANWRSAYGVRAVALMADIAATNGGGWYTFAAAVTDDPAEQTAYRAAAGVMPVSADWFVCSIIPAGTETIPVAIETRNELLETVQTALKMYLEKGAAALPEYTDRRGTPLEGNDRNIMVFHRNGTILVFSAHPAIAGTNASFMTNPTTGISYMPMLTELADRGGGYTSITIYSGETKQNNVSVAYLEPLDADLFLLVTKQVTSYDPKTVRT
ncbi:MAG: hypothetical protein Q4Q04_04665 [Methanocorpusculum sp.]|nr:hypothetical protein [Methanocorpusculum sp.]